MTVVNLEDAEWNSIQYILLHAEGRGINCALTSPLYAKIGTQLQAQKQMPITSHRPNGWFAGGPVDAIAPGSSGRGDDPRVEGIGEAPAFPPDVGDRAEQPAPRPQGSKGSKRIG